MDRVRKIDREKENRAIERGQGERERGGGGGREADR